MVPGSQKGTSSFKPWVLEVPRSELLIGIGTDIQWNSSNIAPDNPALPTDLHARKLVTRVEVLPSVTFGAYTDSVTLS